MHPGICQESLSSRQTKVRKLVTTGNQNHMANAYGLVALCALFFNLYFSLSGPLTERHETLFFSSETSQKLTPIGK